MVEFQSTALAERCASDGLTGVYRRSRLCPGRRAGDGLHDHEAVAAGAEQPLSPTPTGVLRRAGAGTTIQRIAGCEHVRFCATRRVKIVYRRGSSWSELPRTWRCCGRPCIVRPKETARTSHFMAKKLGPRGSDGPGLLPDHFIICYLLTRVIDAAGFGLALLRWESSSRLRGASSRIGPPIASPAGGTADAAAASPPRANRLHLLGKMFRGHGEYWRSVLLRDAALSRAVVRTCGWGSAATLWHGGPPEGWYTDVHHAWLVEQAAFTTKTRRATRSWSRGTAS